MDKINLKKMMSEGSKNYVGRTADYLKRYGVKGLVNKTLERYQRSSDIYGEIYKKYMASPEELLEQSREKFAQMPLISIAVPTYETQEVFLREMIESVVNQSYENWELCIADGSSSDAVETVVSQYTQAYKGIRYRRLEENKGISENTNAALEMAAGEYIGLLDHDDLLARNALYEVVKCINEQPEAEVIYSDEDKVSADLSEHMQPHFKSDFNAELLNTNNYICHFLVVKKSLMEQVGMLRGEFDGAQDYDFVLRCTEAAKAVAHIAKILYHWRVHEGSTAVNTSSKSYAYEAGKRAIEAHFERLGTPQIVEMKDDLGFYRVRYQKENFSFLNILIDETAEDVGNDAATKAAVKQLEKLKQLGVTVHHKMSRTEKNIRLVRGKYILLLEHTRYLPKHEELAEMMGILEQKDVGAVGTKSISKDHKVLQSGLMMCENGKVCRMFERLKKSFKGYMRRAMLTQYVSGISFSCAMVKREAMDMVGGIQWPMPRDYRDMDISRQIQHAGYQIVQDPYVEIEMDTPEEVDRIEENQARLLMRERWEKTVSAGDIFYNSNFEKGNARFVIK